MPLSIRPVFHLAKSILLSNLIPLPAPYKITFALTYRCNSRCRTCNIWKREAMEELELPPIERFFAANPELSWIDLTGGEPFLRRDFVSICEAAVRLCPNLYLLHFPTNGLLPDRIVEGVQKILESPLPRLIVTVSIDGPPALHDSLRGGARFFLRAVETLRRLREVRDPRFQVFAGMTLSRDNFRAIDETLAAIAAEVPGFSAAELHLNLAQTSAHFYGNLEMDISFQSQALEEIQRFTHLRGNRLDGVALLEHAYLRLAEQFVKTRRTPLPCAALHASCFIDPEGRIYPCNADPEIVGTLKDVDFSLARVWQSENAKAIRARIQRGECPHCWTPCEAYQTLFAHLPRTFSTLFE